ncbi:DUF4097 family beta strand repeat protein, partial [bacterium]|nr:DUF4097 family beta strand repeat protein [bacterium]
LTLPVAFQIRLRVVSANIHTVGGFRFSAIQSVSGDIHIERGEFSEGSIETVSGNAVFEGGVLSLSYKSTSGDLTIKEASVEKLALQSVSGDISVKKVNGQISQAEAHTRSGTLEAKWCASVLQMGQHSFTLDSGFPGGNFKLDTISGDIFLE